MKLFLPILISIMLLSINSFSQNKVIEKSEKKKPSWVYATAEDFIIVTGRGTTIDAAKKQILPLIREEIMNSVAVYVKSTSETIIENKNKNNVIHTIERFRNASTLETADIPLLKGLSLNKVNSYYWEKLKDKKTKQITVAYHVKYPFSKRDLEKLLNKFNEKEQETTNKLNEILHHIDDITSLEDIYTQIKQLQVFKNYFVDNRKEQAQLAIVKLKDMLKSIEIVPIENNLGTLKYGMKIGNKFYDISQKPKYKTSECITITSCTSQDHIQVIKYEYKDCIQDEKNFITVKYKYGNTKLRKTFYFKATKNIVDIFLHGKINIHAKNKDATHVNSYSCDFTLVSKHDAAFIITKVKLDWPNISYTIANNLNLELSGQGIHNFSLDINEPIDLIASSFKQKSHIDGTIFFKVKATNKTNKYKFYTQEILTDW